MNKNAMMTKENVKISQLIENKDNPRYIIKPAFEKLMKSIIVEIRCQSEEDYKHTFQILTEAGYNCLPKD